MKETTTKMEIDIETLVTVCFNFYIQGVQDGDSGELDRFTLKGEYSNNYEVFKRYFFSKGFISKSIKGFFKQTDSVDPLWVARVRRDDDTADEILLAKIRKDLQKYTLDIPAEIDNELATTKNALKKIVLRDLKSYIEQYGEDDLIRDFKEGKLVMLKILDDIQQKSFDLNDLAYMNNVENFTGDIDRTLKESKLKSATESMSDIYDTAYCLMLKKILKTFEEREEAKKNLQKFKEEYEKEHEDEEDDDDEY